MIKKYVIFLVLFSFVFGTDAISQWRPDGVPTYLRADFFEQFPDFYKYPINGKIRYYEATSEELKFVPEQTKFLSNDGVEIINLSSSFANAKTETWMAINPFNPSNLIATCNDNAFLGGMGGFRMSAFVSTDAGRNWVHRPTPANAGHWFTPKGNAATIFDPGVAFDREGNGYYIYGFSETTWGDEDKDTEKNGVFVVKTTDNGTTWNGLEEAGINSIVAITDDAFKPANNPFHDRYSLGIDISEDSPHKGNIYVTWRVFRGTNGVVYSRSTDGGFSWSVYQRLATNGQAPQPVVGPNGDVYVTWIDVDGSGNSRAMFMHSPNGGASFPGSPIEAQRVVSIGNQNQSSGRQVLVDKQGIRVSSTPQMAVDISNSPYKGTIYVVQAGRESTNGPYGIYLAKSTNHGLSWNKNIRIDNSVNRRDMFFPSIACDPVSGLLSVLYYTSQHDDANVGVDAYVAISKDGGNTWTHIRSTPKTFYLNSSSTVFAQGGVGNVYWGDYTHIVSYNNKVYPLFWMPTNANYSYGTNALFTAFISPAPQQPINPNFATLLEPTKLKLSWTHPTKNLLGEILGDFKINVFKGQNKIGEVQKSQTPEFMDNDVVYGGSYSYFLETETTDGLKSVRTEINATVGGNPKPMAPTELSWRPNPNGITLTWRNPSRTIFDEPFLDQLKIAIYDAKSNQQLDVVSSTQFIAGELATHTLVIDTEKFYEINIKAIGVRGTLETESDYTNSKVIAYSGAPKVDINENFDNAETQTPIYITNKWGVTTEKAESTPNCITDSPGTQYTPNSFEYFILAPIVLSSEKSTLNFDHIALIDTTVRTDENNKPNYDYGELTYSLDFGKSWQFLRWFNSATSDGFIQNNLGASQWQNLAYNLSQHTGDTVLFRFALGSNDFRQADGWFIDNIKFDNRPSSVNINLIEMTKFSVSPNPVKNFARVSLKTVTTADARIELYDVLGSKVEIRNAGMLSQGDHSFDFDMSNLSDGMYYFRITLDNYIKTIPVSVTR